MTKSKSITFEELGNKLAEALNTLAEAEALNATLEAKDKGRPEHGKTYSLTGEKSITSGNTWAESEVTN